MTKRKESFGSDFAKIDAHVITAEEYEESPEWTDEMFEAADYYNNGVLISRGRPRKAKRAKPVTIRLDPEVESVFRDMGKGWQTKINQALKQWIAEHPVG